MTAFYYFPFPTSVLKDIFPGYQILGRHFFLQYFRDSIFSFSSCLYGFWWEISPYFHYCCLWIWCLCFLWPLPKFSLILIFIWCALSLNDFLCIDSTWDSIMLLYLWGLISFINIGNSLLLSFKIFLLSHSLPVLFLRLQSTHILSHRSQALNFYFLLSYTLCILVWTVSLKQSSNSVFFFFTVSSQLLIPPKELFKFHIFHF